MLKKDIVFLSPPLRPQSGLSGQVIERRGGEKSEDVKHTVALSASNHPIIVHVKKDIVFLSPPLRPQSGLSGQVREREAWGRKKVRTLNVGEKKSEDVKHTVTLLLMGKKLGFPFMQKL